MGTHGIGTHGMGTHGMGTHGMGNLWNGKWELMEQEAHGMGTHGMGVWEGDEEQVGRCGTEEAHVG